MISKLGFACAAGAALVGCQHELAGRVDATVDGPVAVGLPADVRIDVEVVASAFCHEKKHSIDSNSEGDLTLQGVSVDVDPCGPDSTAYTLVDASCGDGCSVSQATSNGYTQVSVTPDHEGRFTLTLHVKDSFGKTHVNSTDFDAEVVDHVALEGADAECPSDFDAAADGSCGIDLETASLGLGFWLSRTAVAYAASGEKLVNVPTLAVSSGLEVEYLDDASAWIMASVQSEGPSTVTATLGTVQEVLTVHGTRVPDDAELELHALDDGVIADAPLARERTADVDSASFSALLTTAADADGVRTLVPSDRTSVTAKDFPANGAGFFLSSPGTPWFTVACPYADDAELRTGAQTIATLHCH